MLLETHSKKRVEANTGLPVNANRTLTNGAYNFVVTGPAPTEENPNPATITKYVQILAKTQKVNGDYVTSYYYRVSDAAIQYTANNNPVDTAVYTPMPDEGVIIEDLVAGTYTVTETGSVLDTSTAGADLYLAGLYVTKLNGTYTTYAYLDPEWTYTAGTLTDEEKENITSNLAGKSQTLKVYESDHPAQREVMVAVFTNELESNTPFLKKQVTDINDSLKAPSAEYKTESPWNDSADFDIGDAVPYRITTNLPVNYYRAQSSYYYELTDEMDNLEYVSGSGRVYAFVKSDTDETGTWYDVTSKFYIEAGEYENKKQTIKVYPKLDDGDDTKNLKNVTSDLKVKNWSGADTHGDDFPYKLPETQSTGTSFANRDLRCLQFRYRATLTGDAVTGSAGNANRAKLIYSDGSDDDGKGETDWDLNRVFTYRLVANKVDASENRLAGARFELYKKYKQYPVDTNLRQCTYKGNTFVGPADNLPEKSDTAVSATENVYVRVTPSDGNRDWDYIWNGIDDGSYLLIETQPPTGYVALSDPIAFDISADHEPDSEDPQLTLFNLNPENGCLTRNVTNGEAQYITVAENSVSGAVPNTPYPDIRLEKIDETTRPAGTTTKFLSGAQFQLLKWNGTDYVAYEAVGVVRPEGLDPGEVVTDDDGIATFQRIEPGEYRIVETKVPDGYVKLVTNDIYFSVEDTASGRVITRYATGMKTALLNGVETAVPRNTRTDNEEITDDDLSDATTLHVTFRFVDGTPVFTVGNEPGVALPSTGGSGTTWLYILGSALIVLAAALLIAKRRSDAA